MFATLEGTGCAGSFRRLMLFLLSVICHVVSVLVFVLIPLVFLNVLPQSELLTFLIAPPSPPAPLPPPLPPPEVTRERVTAPVRAGYEAPPGEIPRGIAPPVDEPPLISLSGLQAAVGTVVASGPLGPRSGVGSGAVGELLPPPPPLPLPPQPLVRNPVPVGGNVQESKLIRRVDPTYPQIARLARVSGTVMLQVIVDEEGNVTAVKVMQGHPLLVEEAVRAVRQWKYSPTLLNGEPVSVTASVTVIFNLTRQ